MLQFIHGSTPLKVIKMSEPKPLPPSLRAHKRYLVFELISNDKIEYGEIVSAVWDSMLNFLGELETSKAKVWFIMNLYDEKNQKGVIRCSHNYVEQMRVVLSLIHILGEKKVIIKIIGVTGTIKSARNKYLTTTDLRTFTGE